MKKVLLVLMVIAALAQPAAHADVVVIPSVTVLGNTENIVLPVYIFNSSALEGVVLPFEIRSVTPGSFVVAHLQLSPGWPLVMGLPQYRDTTLPQKDNDKWYKCDGTGFGTRGAADFVTPECVFFAGVNASGFNTLPGRLDTLGPAAFITFGVSSVAGTFEIDTTCVTPDNHLALLALGGNVIHPSFVKSVVTIQCSCPCNADPLCDGIISDILDVSYAINRAFRGNAPTRDSSCPYERTDVDASGASDVVDVTKVINVAFRGHAASSEYTLNPCSLAP